MSGEDARAILNKKDFLPMCTILQRVVQLHQDLAAISAQKVTGFEWPWSRVLLTPVELTVEQCLAPATHSVQKHPALPSLAGL